MKGGLVQWEWREIEDRGVGWNAQGWERRGREEGRGGWEGGEDVKGGIQGVVVGERGKVIDEKRFVCTVLLQVQEKGRARSAFDLGCARLQNRSR